MTNSVWQRNLTGIERWQWTFDQAAVLNLIIVARVSGDVDVELLKLCLQKLTLRYPHLSARIRDMRNPAFIATSKPIELIIKPWQQDAWHEIAEHEANLPLSSQNGPLFRSTILNGSVTSDIILTFNHVVADGQSGVLIMKELLELYSGKKEHKIPQLEIVKPPLPSLFPSRYKAWLVAIKMFWKSIGMIPIPAENLVPVNERKTGLINKQLPEILVSQLTDESRKHGVTIHAVFVSAMLLSIVKELEQNDGDSKKRILGCASPVDLRRHSDIPKDAIGNIISGVMSRHKINSQSSLWELAMEVHQSIKETVENGDIFALACLQEMTASQIKDINKTVKMGERFNRMAAIVTNLGRLDFPTTYGSIELTKLGFLVSNNANAGSALVLSATTITGATSLNFTFAQPLLSRTRAQRLVDKFVSQLQHIVPD